MSKFKKYKNEYDLINELDLASTNKEIDMVSWSTVELNAQRKANNPHPAESTEWIDKMIKYNNERKVLLYERKQDLERGTHNIEIRILGKKLEELRDKLEYGSIFSVPKTNSEIKKTTKRILYLKSVDKIIKEKLRKEGIDDNLEHQRENPTQRLERISKERDEKTSLLR